MNTDAMITVARIVLAACGRKGYHLSGSLALHVLGIAGARPAHDIDVFTDQVQDSPAVRAAVLAALTAQGYRVEETRTWAYHPVAQCDQNSDLLATHALHGSVTIQLARMTRYFDTTIVDGIPVAAVGELLYAKIEAPEHRLNAKDFVDLSVLTRHIRFGDVASYLVDYVRGMAGLHQVPEAQMREELYVRLAQVADIPDAAFTAYGVEPQAVTRLRADLLAWADRIATAELNASRLDPGVAAGMEVLNQADSLAALVRLARAESLALLSPPQLSSRRGEAMVRAMTASHRLRQLTEQLPEGTPVPAEAADAAQRVEELVEEVQRITLEIQRRLRLTERQRAEEAVLRRALAEELDSDEAPDLHQTAIQMMIRIVRRRRHSEAEEELQHHRPATGPSYGGVQR
ncbi:hypothetical protein [Streptomyces arenae]|uniref:hypothetical protein n=1 Tax=Streptomyces arenae TaxID=29301 RepID=UPI00265A5D18|nr:hypothetical protein [Streptomyces arenae]MCG7202333.1 hypothetical protein [Streptomyces arenae]